VPFQLAVLAIFAIAAFPKSADSATGISFDIGWFSPVRPDTVGLRCRPVRLDLRVLGLGHRTVNEESVDADKTPGRAALLCV